MVARDIFGYFCVAQKGVAALLIGLGRFPLSPIAAGGTCHVDDWQHVFKPHEFFFHCITFVVLPVYSS